MNQRLLVIDDDVELSQMLRAFFASAGWAMDSLSNGREGIERAQWGEYQIVLLGVMLPDADGFELCRQLRARSAMPILMLTACGAEIDRIRGLELGADDCLAKPFNPSELLARVRAILRRHELARIGSAPARAAALTALFTIDATARRVLLNGAELSLTGLEFNLLQLLAHQPGQVLSRDQILSALHGSEFQLFNRTVDVHISSLRKKIRARWAQQEVIKTVRGAGYVFCLTEKSGKAN